METLGNFIKEKRLENNITVRGLALKTGISNAYLSQIETSFLDNPPSDEKIIKIARALNMTDGDKILLLHLAALERTPEMIKKEYLEMKNKLTKIEFLLKGGSDNE